MKTLLNFQPFEIESTQSFLNVATVKELKAWKRLLRQYYYLHNMGIKISKANRKLVFTTLNQLKMYRNELTIMIENNATMDKKEVHIEAIADLQAMLVDLSNMRDENIIKHEIKETMRTMIFFETIVTDEDGFITFKSKSGRKFSMRDSSKWNEHRAMIDKHLKAMDERKKAEKKAAKALEKQADKAQKKSDNFTEKVFEKKRLN